MRTTRHTTRQSVSTTASPAEVYAEVEDLESFPAWWDLEKHPKIEGTETRVVADADDAVARAGLEIEIQRSAGGVTFRSGRTVSWGPETKRYICEVAEPGRRLRLLRHPADVVLTDGVRAIEVTIEADELGSMITLQRESEIPGRGVRAAVQRWGHRRPLGLRAPLRQLAARAEARTR